MILRIFFLLLALTKVANATDFDLMQEIVRCESGFRPDVWGDDGRSYGIAQFQKATFNEFAKQAKSEMKKAHLWPAKWKNPEHQMFLLGWAIDHGKARHWTCFNKLVWD